MTENTKIQQEMVKNSEQPPQGEKTKNSAVNLPIFQWWNEAFYTSRCNRQDNIRTINQYSAEEILSLLYKLQEEISIIKQQQGPQRKKIEKRLINEILKLKSNNISLKGDNIRLNNCIRKYQDALGKKQKELNRFQEIKNKIERFEQIEQKYESMKNENSDLHQRLTSLVRELHELKRDKTAISILSSQPQHYTLVQQFKRLKDEDFRNVSREIFRFRQEYDQTFAQRYPKIDKVEIAKIMSILSNTIFIQGIHLFSQENIDNHKDKSSIFVQKVIGSIRDYLGEYHFSKQLITSLKDLSLKGLDIINNLQQTESPYKLFWIEKKEDKQFNHEQHEAMVGCEERGKIEWTVYPGYLVYDNNTGKERIFEKALVFTVLTINS